MADKGQRKLQHYYNQKGDEPSKILLLSKKTKKLQEEMSDFRAYLKWARELQDTIEKAKRDGMPLQSIATETEQVTDCSVATPVISLPFINHNNDLIIPLYTDPKYRWWQGGQSIFATLMELGAGEDVLDRYVANWRERMGEKEWGN